MRIYPAIDIIDSQVVRLTRGDYDQKKVYNADPLEIAVDFDRRGAGYLHVVDLDGAKKGGMANTEVISEIVQKTNLFVEVGGGIRDEQRIRELINGGAARVILGTAAIEDPDFLKDMLRKYRDKIAVGVDAADGYVAVKGWIEKTKVSSFDFCEKLAVYGVSTIIYTDIATDGAMKGTNLEAFEKLSRLLKKGSQGAPEITASGGITSVDEITKLADLGIDNVIVGKALYEGRLNLEELLRMENR